MLKKEYLKLLTITTLRNQSRILLGTENWYPIIVPVLRIYDTINISGTIAVYNAPILNKYLKQKVYDLKIKTKQSKIKMLTCVKVQILFNLPQFNQHNLETSITDC